METNKACGYYRNSSHTVSHIVSYRFPKQKNKPVGTNLKFNAELNESHDFKPAVVLDTISVEPVGTAGLDVSTETITKTASSSSMCHYTFAKRSISMLLFNILRYIHRRPLHLHLASSVGQIWTTKAAVVPANLLPRCYRLRTFHVLHLKYTA